MAGWRHTRTCCLHLMRFAAGRGASSLTVDQQPTDKFVIAFERVRAACVPACPPDMSPPSINCPSFLRISLSSSAASDDALPEEA